MVGGWNWSHFSIQARVTNTSNLQYWESIHRYFWYFPLLPGLKTNIHFICTTNRSNIEDLGKSNLTRCMMGNKVPNSLLKSVCVCVKCRCVCSFVCLELKEGCGTIPQILWRMLQKTRSVGFPTFFPHERTHNFRIYDHVMGCRLFFFVFVFFLWLGWGSFL